MRQEILILVDDEEIQVAVVEDRELVEFYLEKTATPILAGSIYLGLVHDVLPGMEASFIDIGLTKNAYLVLNERAQAGLKTKSLRVGQKVIVQIAKVNSGDKGAKLTAQVGLPGRFLVLLPFSNGVAVSKKLEPMRDYFYNFALPICPPDMGLIVRTAAKNADIKQLAQELELLLKQWQEIKDKALTLKAPCPLYQEANLAIRAVRDLFTFETDAIFVDDQTTFSQLKSYMYATMPEFTHKVKLASKEQLYLKYELLEQLEQAVSRRVWLRSGGYLTIDKTEALTAIDINTGKYISGSCLAETVLKTNLEAAKEAARQIRLRNIGGVIVIDFIDMAKKKHQEEVLETFKQALANDRSRYQIVGLSEICLLEMTRKSVNASLDDYFMTVCPSCGQKTINFKQKPTS